MKTARQRHGFTLIELMLVVAILGVVIAFSAPSFIKAVKGSPLTRAVMDLTEGCRKARFLAVIKAQPAELRIYAADGRIEVVPVPPDVSPDMATNMPVAPIIADDAPKPSAFFTSQISDEVRIDEIDVNFAEFKDATVARVRFYPNGTSDEFTVIISSGGERRKITLEVVTALAQVEPF